MYAKHFGLSREPFSIAPDPHYLYMSERHREALAHLRYGLGAGGGFVVLTGEIGAGKTTVCRCLLEQVPPRCNVAYIFNPKLSVLELLRTVCEEFHIPVEAGAGAVPGTVKDYIDPLNRFLLNTHATGRNNVLIIDEAQNLSSDVLEQLRLLTNLETSERKLLQIILIGQPELRSMLERPELEQLAQRVIARYHLEPLSAHETLQYVHHRLTVAGLNGPMPFDEAALQRIHELSRGVPRRINLLCDRALLGAYGGARALVTAPMVDKAASEVFVDTAPSARAALQAGRGRWLAAGVAAGVLAGAGVSWMLAARSGGAAATATAGSPSAAATAPVPPSALAAPAVANAVPSVASPPAIAIAASASTLAAPSAAPSAAPTAAPTAAPSAALSPSPSATASAAPAAAPSAAPSSASTAPSVAVAAATESASATTSVSAGAGGGGSAIPPSAAATIADGDGAAPARALLRDPRQAWRELAQLWGLSLPPGDPCQLVVSRQLQCFSVDGSLELVRRLGRPGILTLYDQDERPVYALLTGLAGDSATLRVGEVAQTVSLRTLTRLWRGGFSTYWRTPPGWGEQRIVQEEGPSGRWVAAQLEQLEASAAPGAERPADATLAARIAAFQKRQGLKADGLAGPATLMQLNRAIGLDEPRLALQSPG